MKLRPVFLWVVVLPVFILIVRCTNGDPQDDQGHAQQSNDVRLDLRSEHNSGVSGTASFEDTTRGVIAKLDLRGLPKPNTFYLAHIHPGTCAEREDHEHGGSHAEEGYGHDHGASGNEQGAEIEYPLSQVKSDAEGHGSSTTTLLETSLEKLFSGEPKHVNVHEAGTGNPPILTCADLKRAR